MREIGERIPEPQTFVAYVEVAPELSTGLA
jgi:hypothetical protein